MAGVGDDEGLYSMSRRHRNVLNKCRVYFIKNLIVKPIIDEFVTLGLLNENQEETLRVSPTNADMVRNFCHTIQRLGPTAYGSFLDALTATNQTYIREYIEKVDADVDMLDSQPPLMTVEQGDSCGVGQTQTKSVNDLLIPRHSEKSESDAYQMRGGKYVNVLIINNEDFTDPNLTKRYGSSQDFKNLNELFSQVLQFNVYKESDLCGADMRSKITQFSKEEFHKDTDACIVVIMSHGKRGGVCGTDGVIISIRCIMELFGAEACKHLQKKPKYFIFQCCRGENKETGVDLTDAHGAQEAPSPIDRYPLDRDKGSDKEIIPNMADTLVSYATLDDFVSWRNSTNGSWFIQAFCSVFKKHAANSHVMEMLTMVTNELVRAHGDSYKQQCEHTTRLRQNFYLTSKSV